MVKSVKTEWLRAHPSGSTPSAALYWSDMAEQQGSERLCPDDGACHHNCPADECFRVRTCLPLGDYGQDWSEADKERFGGPPSEVTVEDIITR